jgi:flagellar assembly factor FliW
VVVKTGRFGQLTVSDEEIITVSQGLLGFPEYTRFCLVDSGDDTLILWLQSLENPEIAFPLLEPKIFKPDYTVRLSAVELRDLRLNNINQSAVFSVLTIPEEMTQMTANIKAPLVINLKEQLARQVVLQENEYSVKHPMFKELRTHLLTMEAQRGRNSDSHRAQAPDQAGVLGAPILIRDIPPSLTVRSLV